MPLVVDDNHDETDRREELDELAQFEGEYDDRRDTDSLTVALGERVRLGSDDPERDMNEDVETETEADKNDDFVGVPVPA